MTAPGGQPELADYSRFIRRYGLLLVISLFAGAALGALFQNTQPERFKSVASIELQPLPTHLARDPAALDPEYVTIDTDGQLAKSTRVLKPVAHSIGESVAQVRRNLLVTASPLSSVLHLALTAATPTQAQLGAQSAADNLLRARADLIRSSVSAQIEALSGAINDLQRQLPGASRSYDVTRAEGLNAQIVILRRRLRDLQLVDRSVGRVISAAELPPRGAGLSAKVALGSGGLVGLLGGVLLALAVQRRRRRIHNKQSRGQLGSTGSTVSIEA